MDNSERISEAAAHSEPPTVFARPARPVKQASKASSAFREIVETLILTVLIFVGVRVLVQNYKVEGYSMEPTLQDGQYLLINKIGEHFRQPDRGDIIVFQYPLDPSKSFVKRVIGIPGDTVEIRNGQVIVDGKPLTEPYTKGPASGIYPRTLIPAHEYFVMGDNRNNSSDSRSWGPLPEKDIIGEAWVSYWPIKDWGVVPKYHFRQFAAK